MEVYFEKRKLGILMARKISLNQTWKNCLRMWKWIDKVYDPDSWMKCDVEDLKKEWLRKHIPDADITANCFFCEYNESHPKFDETCSHCPGKLVSRSFHCVDRPSYRYDRNPMKFYPKLLQLDAKWRSNVKRK